MNWSEPPSSFFDAVDSQGYVFLHVNLGEISVGGRKIPLIATFSSQRGGQSDFSLSGWEIPVLSSKLLEVSNDRFRLDQPDGWVRWFWRDPHDRNLLHGQGNWKAELGRPSSEMTTIHAPCGTKMTFLRGRLVEMQVYGRKLTYEFDRGIPRVLRDGGQDVIKVEMDGSTGKFTGLSFPVESKKLSVSLTTRPIVQVVNDKRIVGDVVETLGEIVPAGGERQRFEFSVTESLSPFLKLNDRTITWDPETKRISSDDLGNWQYLVKASALEYGDAILTRLSGKDAEFWSTGEGFVHSRVRNIETTERWFSSGPLVGKLRSKFVKNISTGAIVEGFENIYDEHRRLSRKKHVDGRWEEVSYANARSEFSARVTRSSDRSVVDQMDVFYPVDNKWPEALSSDLKAVDKLVDLANVASIRKEANERGVKQMTFLSQTGERLATSDSIGNVFVHSKLSNSIYSKGRLAVKEIKNDFWVIVIREKYNPRGEVISTQKISWLDPRSQLTETTDRFGNETSTLLRFDDAGRIIEHRTPRKTFMYKYNPDGGRESTVVEP